MPKFYPFLLENEDLIRNHFLKWKEESRANQDRKNRQRLIDILDKQDDIRNLVNNDSFCNALVYSLFPKEVIELFGGVDNLLSLPSLSNVEVQRHKDGLVPGKFMPLDMDICLTMDASLRPVIACRLKNINKPEEYYIVCYSYQRSQNGLKNKWKVKIAEHFNGASSDHSMFYEREIADSTDFLFERPKAEAENKAISKRSFHYLKDIVEGSIIYETNGKRGDKYSCAFSENPAQMQKRRLAKPVVFVRSPLDKTEKKAASEGMLQSQLVLIHTHRTTTEHVPSLLAAGVSAKGVAETGGGALIFSQPHQSRKSSLAVYRESPNRSASGQVENPPLQGSKCCYIL